MFFRVGNSWMNLYQAKSADFDPEKKTLVIHWGPTTKLEGEEAVRIWNRISSLTGDYVDGDGLRVDHHTFD